MFRSGKSIALLALLSMTMLALSQGTARADHRCCAAARQCSNRVYIFKGVLGYSPGMDKIVHRLRCKGYDPVVCYSSQWWWAKRQIVRRWRSGEDRGPVFIVGYSLGAAAGVEVARGLRKEGIPVGKLLLMECFIHADIPDNVSYCFNLYESRRFDKVFIFRGTSVASASPNTTLREIDIARAPHFSAYANSINHFNFPVCPQIQDHVVHQLPDMRQK